MEAAIDRFDVEQPPQRRNGELSVRLEMVVTAIYRIPKGFEEQKRSLERITRSLPRKGPRSP
jgi:hypothetical protein